MLTNNDINFIKQMRDELTENRKQTVILIRSIENGRDPYTDEPITSEVTETVKAIVKGFTGVVGGEHMIVNGVALQAGDVSITFDIGTDLNEVSKVTHEGVNYVLYSVLPKGIGMPNRYECIARRAT